MLLIDYDNNKNALINPNSFYDKLDNMPKTAISIFNRFVFKDLIEMFDGERIATITNDTMEFPIYKIVVGGVELALYQSPVGAPACTGCFEELIALGVENLLLTGTCGCLEKSIKDCSIK